MLFYTYYFTLNPVKQNTKDSPSVGSACHLNILSTISLHFCLIILKKTKQNKNNYHKLLLFHVQMWLKWPGSLPQIRKEEDSLPKITIKSNNTLTVLESFKTRQDKALKNVPWGTTCTEEETRVHNFGPDSAKLLSARLRAFLNWGHHEPDFQKNQKWSSSFYVDTTMYWWTVYSYMPVPRHEICIWNSLSCLHESDGFLQTR